MTKWLVLSFLILTYAASPAWADAYRRQVETEWEPIPGARSYDIELKLNKKVITKNVKEPAWSGRLVPGVYEMRLRAKDIRGVPGDWSTPEPFKVGLEAPVVKGPAANAFIKTNDESTATVPFQWGATGGAEKYVFELKSDDGAVVKSETTREPKLSLNLPVAHKYTWSVKAVGAVAESDRPATGSFVLSGKKIEPVRFKEPENAFVRSLKWTAPEHVKSYKYVLQRYDRKTKKWESVKSEDDYTSTEIPIDPHWPGGKYRVSMVGKSDLRPESKVTHMDFNVREGDRSPAAEEAATIRQSIDRMTGWYAIGSYLLTMMDYQGTNYDRANSRLHYSAVGGTGRAGLGYFMPTSSWGFLGIADMSGIVVDGTNHTFASLEANATYRQDAGVRGEFRHQFGLFYKELPETTGPSNTNITATNNLTTVGPHYGFEYWYAITPKFGLQMNAHLYPALMGLKTTNNEGIDPTLSYQLGFMGSYHLTRTLTGLAGYAYRRDRTDYKAEAGQGSAQSGDLNSVQITGHYLNFYLEWAL